MCIDRRDYNILSVVKYIKTQLECIVGLLLRHPNDNFPDTNKYPKEFKLKVKEVLAPMMRTFQVIHHTLCTYIILSLYVCFF